MQLTRVLSFAVHNPTDRDDPDAEWRARTGLRNIRSLLDIADRYDPDFVVFPEVALQHAARQDGLLEAVAEPIPGPATDAVSEHAVALDSYVLLPMYERDGDEFYNAAALISPDGDVVGTYRKVAPTVGEIEGGISPGEEIPVWETEFGTVGAFICWDCRYPEVGATLGAKGADLVLFPTHGSAHARLRTWALYHGYHIALCDKSEARVYTPRRDVVGDVDQGWGNPRVTDVDLHGGSACISFAEINTDCKSYAKSGSRDWAEAIQREYGGSVVLDIHDEDGIVVVESIDDDVSLSDLEAEYGMETIREYEERTRETIGTVTSDSPLFDVRTR
ncbi:nitrilase-related carbon-nitrogen hydrolase [Halomontanus rarus]|uniref:nitrilase-related carbon-nitrogen hydrolase n=1 Tax=Halomontanus rarus TaxID=3034020 RepID=UPI001A992D6A